jgi:hypothetical protein
VSQLPLIRNLYIETSSRQVMFRYMVTDPIRSIPCVLQVSPKRDLSESIDDLNPVYFTRSDTDRRYNDADSLERAFLVGGGGPAIANNGETRNRDLVSGSTYYYRLMCGGDTRTGSFSTNNE